MINNIVAKGTLEGPALRAASAMRPEIAVKPAAGFIASCGPGTTEGVLETSTCQGAEIARTKRLDQPPRACSSRAWIAGRSVLPGSSSRA